jgi:hypothetical protein
MSRGIGFQRILLRAKDARQNGIVAKFGFNPDVDAVV